jgi:hypothetical protein
MLRQYRIKTVRILKLEITDRKGFGAIAAILSFFPRKDDLIQKLFAPARRGAINIFYKGYCTQFN